MSELSSDYFTPVFKDDLGAMPDDDLADGGRDAAVVEDEDGAVMRGWSFEAVPAGGSDDAVVTDYSFAAVPEGETASEPVVSYSMDVPPAGGLEDGWYPCQVDRAGVLIVLDHYGNEIERWSDVEGVPGAESGRTGQIHVEHGQTTSFIVWDVTALDFEPESEDFIESHQASTPSWDFDPDSEDYERSVALHAAQLKAAVDWGHVLDANGDVVKDMVAKNASEGKKTVEFAIGDHLVLLGGSKVHSLEVFEAAGWAAMEPGKKWATGKVRFKRNRLSANEFVITEVQGDLDDEVLLMALKVHMRDESIYPYPDAPRVTIRRG